MATSPAKTQTPEGYRLIQAFANDAGDVVVLGDPEEEGTVAEDVAHNCDAMGCSSVEHVIARFKLPKGTRAYDQAGAIREEAGLLTQGINRQLRYCKTVIEEQRRALQIARGNLRRATT